MDGLDHVGPGQAQEVHVAGERARVVAEPLAAEVLLHEAPALDHRADGAVEHHDPAREQRLEPVHLGDRHITLNGT